ncbi:Bcr/CflA family efflux MFS transporter [Corticibacter populi]|uniref:Bcr/CflA family efflux transporter n=1 Tax=Corticibacter populi TaxID=1550736 RepID=A0A3M6QS24_9BURK|nr:multidrug effflux MFS transporter [Corticibacter populi]RMX05838.1 Bcr/CflA family efflux MFS transporter [Corticibacter populi]RZS30847.1 DHA1 family bicyclomycin/chloramphenicol resistance-like MFS transporter [Corticibacter populi]
MSPPHNQIQWSGPSWALPALLALLSVLGPFSIDTFLPAFSGIAQSLSASPVQMQQTLSAYLLAFAFMNLFHGALADSYGRRPVVLVGVAVFALASVGCAMAQSIEQLIAFRAVQGLSAGASMVVSRAIIRDLFPPAQAQRVMSHVTLYFGLAPAIAPVIGGWLFALLGWHSIFWFMALLGGGLWLLNLIYLPETLPRSERQPFRPKPLLQGYLALGGSARFVLLALASGIPFNGMFVYILAAPEFLGTHLGLAPTQFFWLFFCTIGGIMSGAVLSGRMAGRVPLKWQIRHGFVLMAVATLINLTATAFLTPKVWLSILPLGLYSIGWAVMMPVVTILVLDLNPLRRGMASSMQACVASAANGLVAGLVVPLVMHSTMLLALASASFMLVGLAAWLYLHWRWPAIGRFASN